MVSELSQLGPGIMFKIGNRQIWKTAITPVFDYLALMGGAVFVYLLRYRWFAEEFLGAKNITREGYLIYTSILSGIVILVYILQGVYEINSKKGFWSRLFQMLSGLFLVLFALIVFLFFNEFNKDILAEGVPVSRFILATGGFVALAFLLVGRVIVWLLEQILYTFGWGKTEIVTIGHIPRTLKKWLEGRAEVSHIHHFSKLDDTTLVECQKLVGNYVVSEIYLQSEQTGLETNLAHLAERYTVDFVFSPKELKTFDVFGMQPVEIDKEVYLEIKHGRLDGWSLIFKRLIDFVFGLLIFILVSPILLLITLAIRLDSKGPIFYLSERVGANGKVFRAWKFRRMKQEYCVKSEKDSSSRQALEFEQELIAKQNGRRGPLYKIKNDPRNTRVGDFLERTSLDDLPQILNVIKGDMSLVGPRPHQPREVAKYEKHHYKVLNAKPGMTGMAQVNGRSNLDFEAEVALDRYYIENWNLLLDLEILLKTPFVMFYR